MFITDLLENMSDDDLHVIEKRWRRKGLFRQQRQSPVPFLVTVLLVLVVLALVVW